MRTRDEYLQEVLDTTDWRKTQEQAFAQHEGDITIGAQAVLRSLKDLGYKSPYHALNELIDNSIEGGAKEINILVQTDEKSNKPKAIAVLDDGHGMIEKMVQYACSLGGSARSPVKKGFGKYGFGLVSSCMGMGNKFTVFSKTEDGSFFYSFVDLDLIEKGDDSMFPYKGNGNYTPAPTKPKQEEPPAWILKEFNKLKGKGKSGTVILIEKLDQGKFPKRKDTVENFISERAGLTYMNYLDKVSLKVGGKKVEPLDPLFLRKGHRFHTLSDDGKGPVVDGDHEEIPWLDQSHELPEANLEIPIQDQPGKKGEVRIRMSWIPMSFVRQSSAKFLVGLDQPVPKGEYNKRYGIVRELTHGIMILRKGRLIDVVRPGTGLSISNWANYDRYIRIEIDFDPSLDADFSVTTSKQQIGISPRMWNVLEDKGLVEAIGSLRRKVQDNIKEMKANRTLREGGTSEEDKSYSPAAQVMAKVNAGEEKSREETEKGTENLKRIAQQIAKETGLNYEELAKQMMQRSMDKTYEVKEVHEGSGNAFFRAEAHGFARHLFINKDHIFYDRLYNSDDLPNHLRWMLEVLLFSFVEVELPLPRDGLKRQNIQEARTVWSTKLNIALESLAGIESDPLEEELSEAIQESKDFPVDTKKELGED